jgi:hypothetical protein
VEAVRDYPGALLVSPRDVAGLSGALLGLPAQRGKRYADPRSWELVTDEFTTLIDQIRGGAAHRADAVRLVPAQAGRTARAVTGAEAS